MVRTPYIFLDIDGVLNTYHHRVRQHQFKGDSSMNEWCPISCENLVRLCKKYNARIVISSNWKDQYELEELQEYFEYNGVPAEYITDMTPSEIPVHKKAEFRGKEIQQWLDKNAPDDVPYLIIDDNSSTILPSQKKQFVHVRPEDGLANPEAIAKAESILERNCS